MRKLYKNVLIWATFFSGIIITNCIFYRFADKVLKEERKKREKAERYKSLLSQWVNLKNSNRTLSEYFSIRDVKTIAIYGYSEMGRQLLDELSGDSGIDVLYFIDKRARQYKEKDVNIYMIEDELPVVDAVVVTPICEYNEISTELQKKTSFRIISLEDIMFSI